jgi:hypothetical protein
MRRLLIAALCLLTLPLAASNVYWNNAFHVGFGGGGKFDVKDKEAILGTNLKSKQSTYTLQLGYSYTMPEKIVAGFTLDFRGFQDNTESVAGQKIIDGAYFFYRADAEIGYPYQQSSNWSFVPYVGLSAGSSKLNLSSQDVTLPTANAFVVKRLFQGKVGLAVEHKLNETWGVGLKLEGLYPLSKPTVRTNVTSTYLGGASSIKTAKRANGYVELPVSYHFDDTQTSLRLVPFLETQYVGKTESALGGALFNNKTFSNCLFGGRLVYLYKF